MNTGKVDTNPLLRCACVGCAPEIEVSSGDEHDVRQEQIDLAGTRRWRTVGSGFRGNLLTVDSDKRLVAHDPIAATTAFTLSRYGADRGAISDDPSVRPAERGPAWSFDRPGGRPHRNLPGLSDGR